MFRVRISESGRSGTVRPVEGSFGQEREAGPRKRGGGRLVAMAGLGLALGSGGALLTVSMVQAEDDAGIRAFHRQEAAARQVQREPARVTYSSSNAYAPARQVWTMPLFQARPDGRIAHPPIELNPFKARQPATRQARVPKPPAIRYDTVSGSADVARTICVRMCDGFHAPIGHLRAASDLKAHEALCAAQNPGVPVKVFRVAAGADTIDGAVSADGRTYGSLPVAYGYEKSADPACRPAIVNAGERRVSLLRDITLRPGDSVVLDGRVRTFSGSTKWPYRASDFQDFRASGDLSASQRRMIDDKVGVSRREAELRSLKRQMRVREASLREDGVASDAFDTLGLRGTFEPRDRVVNTARVVMHSPFGQN